MDERARLLTLAHALRHRTYLFVAVVAGVIVIAGVATIVRPPSYRATAVLSVDERFVSPQGFDISLQAGQALADSFIQLASSPAVLQRACSDDYLGPGSGISCNPSALGASINAGATIGPGWISVSATASSAVRAAALANAVSRAMIEQNIADDAQLLAPISDYLNSEVERLRAEITSQESTIARLQGQPDQKTALQNAQQNLNLLQQQYLTTSQRVQDLGIVQRRMDETLNLSQQATPPAAPYDPDPVRYLTVGLIAGLVVALPVTLVVDRLDDRLLDTEGLAAAAGTRLAIAVAARDSESLTVHVSNPYGVARANLVATHPQLAKLMIVGASDSDRLRPIARGLGAAAVKAGQVVIVLDPEAPALVMGRRTSRRGSKMTVVHAPSAPDRAASSGAPSAADGYDLVITLAPPPDRNPIALSLARSGEVAIVVATAGNTRFSQVKRTTESLRLAGIDVAAAILSIDDPKRLGADEGTSTANLLPAVGDIAAGQARLPTWRGPGA